MIKRHIPLLSAIILCPVLLAAQDFNDVPGRDDDHYLTLIFPKPIQRELEPAALMPVMSVAATPTAMLGSKSLVAQGMVDYAKQFIGVRYHSGGTTGAGFDCSGFTQSIFKNAGINLPHSSSGQANVGQPIELDQVRPGDLLFFKGRNRNSHSIGHVAMVSEVGEDGTIRMIHATIHGGVMIDAPFNTAYYKPRYICARRVLREAQDEKRAERL